MFALKKAILYCGIASAFFLAYSDFAKASTDITTQPHNGGTASENKKLYDTVTITTDSSIAEFKGNLLSNGKIEANFDCTCGISSDGRVLDLDEMLIKTNYGVSKYIDSEGVVFASVESPMVPGKIFAEIILNGKHFAVSCKKDKSGKISSCKKASAIMSTEELVTKTDRLHRFCDKSVLNAVSFEHIKLDALVPSNSDEIADRIHRIRNEIRPFIK